MSVLEYKRNQLLLSLVKSIFEDTSSLDVVFSKIMSNSMQVLDCNKSKVYLLNEQTNTSNPVKIFKEIWELEKGSEDIKKIR